MNRDHCLDVIAPNAPKSAPNTSMHGQVQALRAQHNGNKFVPTRLGKLASLLNGDRGENYPSRSDMLDDGVPFINAGHLHDGSVQLAGMNYLSEAQFATLRGGSVLPGDILYCLRGSLGKVAFVDNIDRAAIASSLVIIRVNADVSARYVYHFLTSPVGQQFIKKFDNGAAQPNLSARSLAQFDVPLPPLPEQKRIAAILDKADAIRRKRQRAIQLTQSLLRSAFLEMFGDPVTNPKGWPVKKLEGIVDPARQVTYGIVQPGPHVDDGVPYIKTGDIKANEILLESLCRTSPEIAAKYRRSEVVPGDLVFTIRATVGAVAVVPDCLRVANLTQGTARIAPSEAILRDYLVAYLRSDGASRWLRGEIKGATFKEITLARLRCLPVPVPPLALQHGFVQIAGQCANAGANLKSSLSYDAELGATLTQRAFVGRL